MTVFEFYKLSSFKKKCLIIKTILEIPGLVVHELAHVIMAWLTFSKVVNITIHYWYKVVTQEDGSVMLQSYHISVKTETRGSNLRLRCFRCLLINIAPLVVAILMCYINIWLCFWVILSWNTFGLSDPDINNAKENLNQIFSML